MNLKSAALLALIGTILVTLLALITLVGDVSAMAQGLIPMTRLLTSLIDAFAGITVVVFFYAFHKAQ